MADCLYLQPTPHRRPYTAFGLSLAVHALALFGVVVAVARPALEEPPGALAVTWVSNAEPAATTPAAAPPSTAAPAHVARPRPSRKLVIPTPTERHSDIARAPTPPPAAPTTPIADSSPAPSHRDTADNATGATASATTSAASPAGGRPGEHPSHDDNSAPPRFEAAYLRNPAPAYPSLSRRLGEEGRVLLRVHVQPGGQPDEVRLHQSCGYARLDEAALDAVRRWQFVPARQGGNPVAAWVVVPIQFNLRSTG